MSARSRAGAAAQRAGSSLEADLLAGYRPPFVFLQRTGPPWHYVKDGRGGLRVVIDEDGVPDWHATVMGDAWVFETKATSGDRWPLAKLEPAQAEHLAGQHAAKATVGVLVRFDKTGAVFWLPWPALQPLYDAWRVDSGLGLTKRGDASLTAADCGRIGRRVVCLRWWLEVAP